MDGMDLSKIKESRLVEFRRDNLGFVFQEFNLLDTLSVEDNIYLPLVLAGKSHVEMEEKIKLIAQKLGIMELLKKYLYEISGGQKQRVAVARALITDPKLILIVLAVSFLLFALLYAFVYKITSNFYYAIVSGKKES